MGKFKYLLIIQFKLSIIRIHFGTQSIRNKSQNSVEAKNY